MTRSELKELERLREENAALKRKKNSQTAIKMRVSQKGGVSVYGLQRFPVTLYKEQWESVLAMAADIRSFIQEHSDELKSKGE